MKYLISKNPISKESLTKLPLEFELKTINDFYLIYEKGITVIEHQDYFAFVDGYIIDHENYKDQNKTDNYKCIENIIYNWPIAENFSGSFSISVIHKTTNQLIICNDPVGPYPLYYSKNKNLDIIVSNSILCLGWLFNFEKDEVGIYQRLVGPELSNLGSRTILKRVKRLLPGEKLTFSKANKTHQFDNSLYANLGDPNSNLSLESKRLHKLITDELKILNQNSSEIYLALSGGLDSRILLSTVSSQNLNCLTYGSNKYYETKLAKKLAKVKGAIFINFDDEQYIFPKPKTLEKYTLETESVFITNWLAILENIKPKCKEFLLIGDMCESIPARNIGKFNLKNISKSTFLKTQLWKENFQFTKSSKDDFQDWKNQIIKRFMFFYQPISLENSNFKIAIEDLHKNLMEDLNEIFDRISDHNLPYIELYEELFKWFTHARSGMNNQITLCNQKFTSISPTMGMKILRETSNIHPNLRISNRLMDAMLNSNSTTKKLRTLPTSQAPFVSQKAPKFLKFIIWGTRSYIDSLLVKRIISKKNSNLRYRVLPSYNWVKAYTSETNFKKFQSYFTNKKIGSKWYSKLEKNFIKKSKLESWPFTNTVFISAASLNKELELIDKYKIDK
ncbi:asparagine synthetase B family protein [Zunongwangia atlantica]|uniref:asparagine synthase (glutamine-hydrolyzing) n=1 Tax=Zunongwangia atlantica 22II14-10F7 TaxID=1185767 RepID=A0A1Y1T8R0_9FLAO|nr:hypothetical protein [Zunongwangia atlantica]ORL47451.1 N-terminal nucleophile aminohydrolase [Zunongwangia atlantica 22II14-10F7]